MDSTSTAPATSGSSGNYFGVEPDGVTQAANGKDIEVTSTSDGEFEATGNAIGTRVSSDSGGDPLCDGGCNVISGADIERHRPGRATAVRRLPQWPTTVAGNYIGLDAERHRGGPERLLPASAWARRRKPSSADPKAGEANRINGGSVGVLAGPAPPTSSSAAT